MATEKQFYTYRRMLIKYWWLKEKYNDLDDLHTRLYIRADFPMLFSGLTDKPKEVPVIYFLKIDKIWVMYKLFIEILISSKENLI